ncbi:MAG: hypothetical protein AAFO03_05790 [Bacteroidota bacterium]
MQLPARIDTWLSNARAFQLFQLLRQGGLIIIAIALGHSGLAVAEIGYYEMLTYLGYLLTFFWVTGFMQGLLSQFNRLGIPEQRQLIFQAFGVFSIASLALGAVIYLFESNLLLALVRQASIPYLWLFLVFLLTNLVASLQEHFYLLRQQKLELVIYGALTATAQILVVALPPWLGYDFRWSFVGLAVLGILKWLWLLRFTLQAGKWEWSNTIFNDWWRISWPLGVYALVAGLSQAVGPWLVGHFFAGDSAAFALYRYGARELPLLSALAGALGSALIPAIAAQRESGLQELKLECRRLYHLIFPLSIVLLLTAQFWFPLVFDPKFTASVPLFNTFLLLTMAHLLFARTILVALEDTRWVPLFALFSLLLQLGIGFWIVPSWGLIGIATTAVIAFSLEKLGMVVYVQLRHGISLPQYTPLRWWLLYSLLLVLTFYWTTVRPTFF